MEVMAYGAVVSSDMDPDSTGGEGSSERSVIGRREGDNCIIYHAAFQPLVKKGIEGERWNKSYLHNTRHAAAGREHLTPVPLLTPRNRPPTVGLAASGASLYSRLLLLLL
jgi:hypothetical protein